MHVHFGSCQGGESPLRTASDGVVDFGEHEVALSFLALVGEETCCCFSCCSGVATTNESGVDNVSVNQWHSSVNTRHEMGKVI
jgi:hypothetical protein